MDKKKDEEEEYEDEEEEEEEDDEDKDINKQEIPKKEEPKKEEIIKEHIKIENKKIENENDKKEEKKEEDDNEEEEEEEDDDEEEKKEIKKEDKIEEKKEGIKNNNNDEIIKKTEEKEPLKKEEPKKDEPKKEEPKKEEAKKEETKKEEPKKEEPKKEETKKKEDSKNETNDIEKPINEKKTSIGSTPPVIPKFHIPKSSSNPNILINKNVLTNLNANEIRFKDILETSKLNHIKNNNIKTQKGCYKCNNIYLSEEDYTTFSCGHKSCEECLIKDLLLLKFKNIENKEKIIFSCICLIGKSPEYEYENFIEKIKKINLSKQQIHKCKNHQNEAYKYCKDCELWLCTECLTVHEVFNKNHILSDNGVPLRIRCQLHDNEFTQFYCLQCNQEVCPFCITKIGKHWEHKTIKFEKMENFANEIFNKLKYKTYEECEQNLNDIRDKNINEKNNRIEDFKSKTQMLIDKIKVMENKYINEINEKINYLNKVIDVMKECYKYFYLMISKEKKEYNDLNFLREISEINTIKSLYSSYDFISKAFTEIENFEAYKNYFSYNIIPDNSNFQYSSKFEKIFHKKKRLYESPKSDIRIQSKYTIQSPKFTDIKYDKVINTKNGNIYAITKINDDEIAIARGNNIYLIQNLNSYVYETIDKYPPLIGHSKNIICMTLLTENKLASGSEDKTIKIWDISKKKLLFSLNSNYQKIDSLLPYKNNCLIVGAFNTIKIIKLDSKKEIISLFGHEKSICCIIEIYPDIIATGSYDNTIKLWDIKNRACELTLYGHDSPVFCLLLLKDGRLISGSGSKNKSLKVWNLDKKICEFSLIGHRREVRDIKQLKNGLVITASMDTTIKIWNIKKRICVQTLISHHDVIFCLCLINNHNFISGGRDHDVIIWKY